MLDIIDNLNDSDLPENSVLVSLDVVNVFPSIDNESGLEYVWNAMILYSVTKFYSNW